MIIVAVTSIFLFAFYFFFSPANLQIHAVYTPEDSLVIGGNFLHGYRIGEQIAIYNIERRTQVPAKFRFPYFEQMLWYASKKYLEKLKGNSSDISKAEMDGIHQLYQFLNQMLNPPIISNEREYRKQLKSWIPPEIQNPEYLLKQLKEQLYKYPGIINRIDVDTIIPNPRKRTKKRVRLKDQ